MKSLRQKFAIVTLAILIATSILGNSLESKVFADNPNEYSQYHSLTGGWDKNLLSSSGKHWTKFRQIDTSYKLYATIKLNGYNADTEVGSYVLAFVRSSRSVDLYHTHYHSGGVAN